MDDQERKSRRDDTDVGEGCCEIRISSTCSWQISAKTPSQCGLWYLALANTIASPLETKSTKFLALSGQRLHLHPCLRWSPPSANTTKITSRCGPTQLCARAKRPSPYSPQIAAPSSPHFCVLLLVRSQRYNAALAHRGRDATLFVPAHNSASRTLVNCLAVCVRRSERGHVPGAEPAGCACQDLLVANCRLASFPTSRIAGFTADAWQPRMV